MGAAHHEGMARSGERVERSSGTAPPRQPLTVEVERAGGRLSIVSLAGELDLGTIPLVESKLFGELEAQPAVILDLTQLRFIDSSGIALLIQAFRGSENGGGGALHTVIARESQVERVFTLVGIDRAMAIHLTRAEALDALDGAGGG